MLGSLLSAPTFLEDTESRKRPRRAPSRATDRPDPHPPQTTSQHEGIVFLLFDEGGMLQGISGCVCLLADSNSFDSCDYVHENS